MADKHNKLTLFGSEADAVENLARFIKRLFQVFDN